MAAATKRDSTAMKTIAIVTMVFLPGAYVAVSFLNFFIIYSHLTDVI